jgi:molybdopterin converting factor small subunit
MHVTIHLLGSLRHIIGDNTCTLEIPDRVRLEQAVDHLVTRYPALETHRGSWHFAVNKVHAEADTVLQPGDDLSIFPYIAGG